MFQIVSLLGVGAFGVVLEVKNLVTNQISALKVNLIMANYKVLKNNYIDNKSKESISVLSNEKRTCGFAGTITSQYY